MLLWALGIIRKAVGQAFGDGLHRAIQKGTRNPVLSLLSGMVVTIGLQSSTATALILASFMERGLMSTAAGLSAMLGADIGTTLVAQLLSFDISFLSPLLVIIGFLLQTKFKTRGRLFHLGRLVFALGVVLLAWGIIRQTSIPMRESKLVVDMLSAIGKDRIFACLLAAVITWVFHSSLAMVLLISALAGSLLDTQSALAMVLGANLGGALIVFGLTLRDRPAARRIPVGNLCVRLIGVVGCLIFFPLIMYGLKQYHLMDESNPARFVVFAHTGFNVIMGVLGVIFIHPLTKLTERLVPIKPEDSNNPNQPQYLDKAILDTPSLALTAASRESLRIAEILEHMLEQTILIFKTNRVSAQDIVKDDDNAMDRIYAEIKSYMVSLATGLLDPKDAERHLMIFTFATNMEHAGDIVEKSLLPLAQKKARQNSHFSSEGWNEIVMIHNEVMHSLKLVQSLLLTRDIYLARDLLERKDKLREYENQATMTHFQRMQEGNLDTMSTSTIHLDVIRDYRRINAHICALAYNVVEREGELLSSRLKERNEDGQKKRKKLQTLVNIDPKPENL
jgi:phosphate:Na+ symporter